MFEHRTAVCFLCCGGADGSKYKYEAGSSYEYRYEAETRTTMSGAAEDTAIITVTARATVEVLGHCEMALRVSQGSRALYLLVTEGSSLTVFLLAYSDHNHQADYFVTISLRGVGWKVLLKKEKKKQQPLMLLQQALATFVLAAGASVGSWFCSWLVLWRNNSKRLTPCQLQRP